MTPEVLTRLAKLDLLSDGVLVEWTRTIPTVTPEASPPVRSKATSFDAFLPETEVRRARAI